MVESVEVVNIYRNYFARNKDHSKLLAILKESRERSLLLNTRHNIIEIHYFTGEYNCSPAIGSRVLSPGEKTSVDWFGASYEILDALFDKYKDDKAVLIRLAKFCMRSKSKTYWLKLKTIPLAKEIMAAMLGGADEDI